MTQINNTEIKKIFQDAVKKDDDFTKKLLKYILQIVLEEERDEQIGVEGCIRNEKQRKGTRNGYKSRSLNTRLGRLKLKKPQISYHLL